MHRRTSLGIRHHEDGEREREPATYSSLPYSATGGGWPQGQKKYYRVPQQRHVRHCCCCSSSLLLKKPHTYVTPSSKHTHFHSRQPSAINTILYTLLLQPHHPHLSRQVAVDALRSQPLAPLLHAYQLGARQENRLTPDQSQAPRVHTFGSESFARCGSLWGES